jgi:flavin-dependent dehydrogenase
MIQGNWKNIELPVPFDRTLLSVYRGALPFGQHEPGDCFDSWLLDRAMERGAQLMASRVTHVYYDSRCRPVLRYLQGEAEKQLSAEFVVFAGGVNEKTGELARNASPFDMLRSLQPRYDPPKSRHAIIFEMEATGVASMPAEGDMHFVESSSGGLHLEMCSIIPKRNFFTVSLIGKSVDRALDHKAVRQLVDQFLALPRIRRTLPLEARLTVRCICNPQIVVGTARMPMGERVAAVGDMATSRQYKDGILSANLMADALARTALGHGVDEHSLYRFYGRTIARFRRDNRFARIIFFLYRRFFTNKFLSRMIYQTYSRELKWRPEDQRNFGRIFWNISSGDKSYEKIALSMLRPATMWQVLRDGFYVTLRNGLAERFFGLDWSNIGRFPVIVSWEELGATRASLRQTGSTEFECVYRIRLKADSNVAMDLLSRFGEPDRPFLHPRWVQIRRTSGRALQQGSVISYRIFGGLISFKIVQTTPAERCEIQYRVHGGFADGGLFLFKVEPGTAGHCFLTVYLAFDYARGDGPFSRIYWRLFRLLFPEFIHEVLWNHALCEFRHAAEFVDFDSRPEMINVVQL